MLILYKTSLSSIRTEFLTGCKWVCKVVAKEIKGALGHQIQDSPLPRVHLVICHITKHARCYRGHEISLTSKELVVDLDLPGCPVGKTLHFQCRGHRFDFWFRT